MYERSPKLNSPALESLTAERPHTQVELHHEELKIHLDDTAQPLMSQVEAVNMFGLNGDVIAIIKLPTDEGMEPKNIAVVDYGPETSADNPKHVFVMEGEPKPALGVATERYGLTAFDYSAGHLAAMYPLTENQPLVLGRSPSPANFKLGLKNPEIPDNELISRNHLTVTLEAGVLAIADHSTNGTEVIYGATERDSRSQAMYQAVANVAVTNSAVISRQ